MNMNTLLDHASHIRGAVLLLAYDGLSEQTKSYIRLCLNHWLHDYSFDDREATLIQ